MGESLKAVKSTPTTTPSETYVEATHKSAGEGVLLYRPEDNSFIALYDDEWRDCRAEGDENKTAIEELQDANREVTAKSLALEHLLIQPNSAKAAIAQARKDLDLALNTLSRKSDAAKKRVEAITDQKVDPNKLIEVVPLTLKRIGTTKTPIYVSAKKLDKALRDKRFYLVDGSAERKKPPKEKLFNGTKLNTDEVRNRILNRVQDKAKFSAKWKWAPDDADHFSGILTDWAKVMGASATSFLEREQKELLSGIFGADKVDPKNPYRMIDMKPEAQFMRWTAGAGGEATFMPFQGSLFDKRDKTWTQRFKRASKAAQFALKANAEASFAVGEAKVETILYLPHAAGWHLDTNAVGQPLDFGFFRLRADLLLSAVAGASVAMQADAALMITGDKQGLKGTPRNQAGAKAKVGAKGEAKVFVGAKEGIDLAGALQWLNPEGITDPHNPKKVDANQAIASYVDVASVSPGVSVIEGLAATLGFECDYRNGKFVIAAKASGCLGLGCGLTLACEVGVEQIGQFFMCVAHQLKQVDYKKTVGLMGEQAFYTLNQIFFLVGTGERKLETFVGRTARDIEEMYERALNAVEQRGEAVIKQIERQLKSGWGWFSYMPPEARGAAIWSLGHAAEHPKNYGNNELRNLAAFSINELVATTQSIRHLENTLDRITADIGEETGRNPGIALINSVVAGTKFEGCVDRCGSKLAAADLLLGRPFMRNDEPNFVLAQMALHHPAYTSVA
jgi:hypothetical protein